MLTVLALRRPTLTRKTNRASSSLQPLPGIKFSIAECARGKPKHSVPEQSAESVDAWDWQILPRGYPRIDDSPSVLF